MASPQNEEEEEFQPSRAHNPAAPLHQLFEISSTLDPSYLISMIRRLLPSDVKDREYATGSGSAPDIPEAEVGTEDASCLVENEEVAEMESSDKHDMTKLGYNDDHQDSLRPGNSIGAKDGSAVEKIWEECGCVLWDLSASEEHAQFMVQNLILEVLLVNLMVFRSSRVTEICLGMLGNIACHEVLQEHITSTEALVQVIVEQLLLDDVPSLCEACRVLTLCLQGSQGVIWAEKLQVEPFISRILWIAENTLNPLLLSKVVDLLLAVLESRTDVASILLPPMMKLDLSNLLVKLLEFEIHKLREGISERYGALDSILRAIEALSAMDMQSHQICLNRRLWPLVKEMVELPEKFEVSGSCVTAAVVLANILAESDEFTLLLSEDVNILQGLFDVLAFASDDPAAKSAVWSIIAWLLALFLERGEMNPKAFYSLVSILVSRVRVIEDDALDCPTDARLSGMMRISELLYRWKSWDQETNSTWRVNNEVVDRLLRL